MTSFPVPSQPTTSMTRPRLKGMTGDDRNAMQVGRGTPDVDHALGPARAGWSLWRTNGRASLKHEKVTACEPFSPHLRLSGQER
jgi:hypothetical protein